MRRSGAPPALLSQADSFKPLAVMRFIMGGVLVFQAFILWKYRAILLDPQGPVPWSLSDTWIHPILPKLSHLLAPFAAIGMGPASVVSLVLALHALAAAFFMVGYKTRVSTAIAWATLVLIQDSACAFTYGIGAMLLIALFYSLFMPVGREWSVDRMLQAPASRESTGDASLCVLVFRLHLCIIYIAAAVAKAVGDQWWTGEAVWRALSLPQFQQFDPAPLAAWPGLLAAAGIVTVLTQLAYPILVWTRLRVPIVIVIELTHLGIALFLGLWLFSLAMIALNTAAFGQALWRALSTRVPARPARPSVARLEVIYDGACPFCNDYVRYQRLQASASTVELVDARNHPEVLAAHAISASDLEDGMVVIADGRAHRGADAVHLLSTLSEPPAGAWVRAVAAICRSRWVARLAYPPMRLGRRIALAFLGIPRFTAASGAAERAQRD